MNGPTRRSHVNRINKVPSCPSLTHIHTYTHTPRKVPIENVTRNKKKKKRHRLRCNSARRKNLHHNNESKDEERGREDMVTSKTASVE